MGDLIEPLTTPAPQPTEPPQLTPIAEAERYARLHRQRAALIRRLGHVPHKLNCGPLQQSWCMPSSPAAPPSYARSTEIPTGRLTSRREEEKEERRRVEARHCGTPAQNKHSCGPLKVMHRAPRCLNLRFHFLRYFVSLHDPPSPPTGREDSIETSPARSISASFCERTCFSSTACRSHRSSAPRPAHHCRSPATPSRCR